MRGADVPVIGKIPRALVLLWFITVFVSAAEASKFWDDFYVNFGASNVKYPGNEPGKIVDLVLDKTSGAGFRSKYPFLFGRIGMKLKLVRGNSAGIVTSFYLASIFKKWSELDFEFLGNVTNEPYVLQTNVFGGEREERIYLWFETAADYHYYGIHWNHELIFKDLGIPYLEYEPMYVTSSIWNGETWATRGGADRVDWRKAPFMAFYTDFDLDSCAVHSHGEEHSDSRECYKKLYSSWYGQPEAGKLTEKQVQDLKRIQHNYVIYDYCTDAKRFHSTPPECALNRPQ